MHSKLSLNERSTFYWQLAVLLRSGATLPEAVVALRLEEDLPKIIKIAKKIQKEMAAGTSFAECLQRHDSLFNAALHKILTSDIPNDQKADILQQTVAIEEQFAAVGATGTALLRSVLWYPMLVLSIAVVITFFVSIFVTPVFKDVFNNMGEELPALTGLIVTLASNPLIVLLAFAVLLVGGKVLLLRRAEKMPVIGTLLRKIAIVQFSHYFSLMTAANFSFKESLEGAADSVTNPNYSARFKELVNQIANFSDLQTEMRKTDLFPEMLLQMAAAAKTPEQLSSAMGEAAVCYSKNIGRVATKKTDLLDLLVLLVLGVLIGVLVIGMYLPIFFFSL